MVPGFWPIFPGPQGIRSMSRRPVDRGTRLPGCIAKTPAKAKIKMGMMGLVKMSVCWFAMVSIVGVSWNSGTPSYHPFIDGFSRVRHPAIGEPPFMEPPSLMFNLMSLGDHFAAPASQAGAKRCESCEMKFAAWDLRWTAFVRLGHAATIQVIGNETWRVEKNNV